MATKYLKFELSGAAAENVHAAIGESAPGGQIVRTHTQGGKTTVYVAVDEGHLKAAGTHAKKAAGGTEVSLDEVLRIG